MNLKNNIILLFVFIFSLQSISQNYFNESMTTDLHEKYWFYRDRLKYFVIPGEGPGNSIVFSARNFWESNKFALGDQTIDLGFYIAILATEYKELNDSFERNQTLTELYYAINAFERLDLCETNDPWFKDVAYHDGFFMRHDIDLMNGDADPDYDYINFGMPPDIKYNTQNPGMPAYVEDIDFGENITQNKKEGVAMSQDQAAFMIMGLGMVNKCLPYGEISFYNTVTGDNNPPFNFVEAANENINNIGDYIANVSLDNGPPFFDLMDMEDGTYWELVAYNIWPYPSPLILEDIPSYWTTFDPNGNLVQKGAWSYLSRYGFKKAIEKLTTHNIQTLFPNDISIDDGSVLWKAYAVNAPTENHFNRVWASALASIGKSWNIWGVLDTDERIYELLDDEDQQFLYLLMYILFQGDDTDANTYYINDGTGLPNNFSHINTELIIHDDLLQTAPWCGPYEFIGDNNTDMLHFDFCDCDLPRMASDGWASQNRFRNGRSEQNGDDPLGAYRGNWPGLDYMLLYNLFHYYLNWWYGWDYGYIPYRNMINSVSDQEYPYAENGSYIGTASNPANLRAFNSFEYNGTISEENGNNGELNLIAGESIKLTPGFHVYQGGHFSAKIEEFDCWARSQDNKSSMFADNNYIQYEWEELPDNSPFITSEEETQEFEKNSPIEESGSIIVIPNPAKIQIQFQFENATSSSYTLIIRDVYGNTIITEPSYQSGVVLNISTLSNGIYIAEVVIDGRVYQEKFVVL